jgi:hypothetical protein
MSGAGKGKGKAPGKAAKGKGKVGKGKVGDGVKGKGGKKAHGKGKGGDGGKAKGKAPPPPAPRAKARARSSAAAPPAERTIAVGWGVSEVCLTFEGPFVTGMSCLGTRGTRWHAWLVPAEQAPAGDYEGKGKGQGLQQPYGTAMTWSPNVPQTLFGSAHVVNPTPIPPRGSQ